MIGYLKQVHLGFGNSLLTFEVSDKDTAQVLADKFYKKDVELDIEVKKHSKKRSVNANNYCWELCTRLSEVLSGETKEDVYRRAIREVGLHKDIELRADAVQTMRTAWNNNGVGWFSETVDFGEYDGFILVRFYYGSSVYNKTTMSKLIDWLVEEAKLQGIEVYSAEELSLLKESWQCQDIQKV